jgi:hypothetical protein
LFFEIVVLVGSHDGKHSPHGVAKSNTSDNRAHANQDERTNTFSEHGKVL